MEITKLRYTKKGKTQTYICRIWYIVETKEIVFLDCECWNFNNKQLRKTGKVFLTKIQATPCKHLKPQVEALFKQGYKIKQKNSYEGSDTCTAAIRKGVLELCKHQCVEFDCSETNNLQIHRIIPGYLGGKYSLTNCDALCPTHHKKRHAGEFV
jgi:hypothetical protein